MRDITDGIFDRLSSAYYHFTASEKKIADYILNHRIEVQFMSITELSAEAGVSEATISRFCKNMGLRSYNDFKLSAAKACAVIHSESDGDSQTVPFIRPSEEISILSKRLMDQYCEAVRFAASFLNEEDLNAAADILTNARMVLCIGQGGSMIAAEEASHLFGTVSPKFFSVRGSHAQALKLSLLDSGDAVIFFSYSGADIEIVELLKIARNNGTKVILITRFLKSPASKLSDVVLQCGANDGSVQYGSVPAFVSSVFVLDMLFGTYCRRNSAEAMVNKEKTTDVMLHMNI